MFIICTSDLWCAGVKPYNPLFVVEKFLIDPRDDYRVFVEKSLGLSLPKGDPGRARDLAFKRFRKLFKYFFRRCCRLEDNVYDCVYEYNVSTKETLTIPVLASARGTVIRFYGRDGVRLLAFPFMKFPNLWEYREYFSGECAVVESSIKYDGTLVIVWRDPEYGVLRYNTRGLLDIQLTPRDRFGEVGVVKNKFVRVFLKRKPSVLDELGVGETVMYEITGYKPASLVVSVVDATKEMFPNGEPRDVVYVGYRDQVGYLYSPYEKPKLGLKKPSRIECDSIDCVKEWVDRNPDDEGVVVWCRGFYRDNPGWRRMVKVKNRSYALCVEAGIGIGRVNERVLARSVYLGISDDIKPYLSKDLRKLLEELELEYTRLYRNVERLLAVLTKKYLEGRDIAGILRNIRLSIIVDEVRKYVEKGGSIDRIVRKIAMTGIPRRLEDNISRLSRINKRIEGYITI